MKKQPLFILYTLFIFFAIACQTSDLEKMEAVDQETLPDEVSENVELVYSDSGRIKRILKSPLIHKYTKDSMYTVFPRGVEAQFFDKNGKVVTQLTCGYGLTSGKKNEKLFFRRNVRITNDKKETLISEEIYLKDNYIYSDSTVYIITPSITLRGTSLVAPRDFSSYKLTNPVGVARAEALQKSRKDVK